MVQPNISHTAQHDESEADLKRRETLAALVKPVMDALQQLDMSDENQNAQHLLEVVNRDTFKLLIMGEFKTGKSTFINALLGEKVLPSYATPTTAIINEVKYGDTPRALLHFREEGKDPLEIPVNELEDYVVIKDNPEEEIRNSPYSHVELFWNLDLCRNRVEIIDSPGLNENKVREDITLDYLRKVDGIIFVMLSTHFWGMSEQKSVELLKQSGHQEFFFILNQFDLLENAQERERVRKYASKTLNPQTRRQDAIYFVSARDALRARVNDDSRLFQESGFVELEAMLHHFLWDERSRVKARRAAQELQLMIARTHKVIPDRRALVSMPVKELQQRSKEAEAKFRQVELDQHTLITRYEGFRRDMYELVRGKVREFFIDVDGMIEPWAKDYDLRIKLDFDVRGQIEDGVKNIATDLNDKLETELDTWSKSVLIPFVEERMKAIKSELERLAEDFEASLRRARLELLGAKLAAEDLSVTKEGPNSALERILAAAGGFFIAGFAGAGIGAVFGWREVIKAILPQILAAMAAFFIGLPLLPVMIVTAILHGGFTAFNILRRIKEETAKAYRQKLREIAADQADTIARQIDVQLAEIQTQIERGTKVRIASVTEQVQSALAIQQKGEAEVEAKLAEILEAEKLLTDISVQLIGFIHQLDQTNGGDFDYRRN